MKREHIRVSGGDRVAIPPLTIEVGGAAETVNVAAEAALVQSQSGERSFAITTEQVENLPIGHGNFTNLTAFAPGVVSGGASAGGTRLGGVSQNNIMMDGVSAMDTGNNGQMINMNIESIGEVKILTQGYQAEYGRSSGLQITAVTKSGTNQFRGSGYSLFDRLRLEREFLGAREERRRQARDLDEDPRLHHRRPGRQARRHQQAVLLLRPRIPSDYRRDQQWQRDPSARADRSSSVRATSRRAWTTTATLIPAAARSGRPASRFRTTPSRPPACIRSASTS